MCEGIGLVIGGAPVKIKRGVNVAVLENFHMFIHNIHQQILEKAHLTSTVYFYRRGSPMIDPIS